ncbi:hypothetical protein KI387_012969, partial [Taxus chinensis]
MEEPEDGTMCPNGAPPKVNLEEKIKRVLHLHLSQDETKVGANGQAMSKGGASGPWGFSKFCVSRKVEK